MKFENKVVYQIYPKSFKDSNNDGWGDLKGVIEKLDYLKDLGIDIIWFNAMFISPQKDNGYDVADYRLIDERYGTMEEFKLLCDEAKKRNIDIMLDMVFNHSSTEHQWFQKALEGDEKYKNYYIFKKGKAPGVPPTNWQSKFGGSAWEYVEKFDEWYLHLFDVTQADLNWENPEVRQELYGIVKYWMNLGVKGFRFDVVNLISKDMYLDDPNNFDGRQFYTDGPKIHEYLQDLNKNTFGNDSDCVTVGEMSSTTIENCVKYANLDGKELSMVFTFHHLKVDYKNKQKWELMPFDFEELKQLLHLWQSEMAKNNAWNAVFLNNHDQPRAISRFTDDKELRYESATMLATLIHMMRGTPYVYQGEEIGMTNAYFTDINQYVDVESTNIYKILLNKGLTEKEIHTILQARSRDNSRTPMQWDNSKNGGFTNGTPWLEVNKNYTEINVLNDLQSEKSIFKFYKKLIAFRKEFEVISLGDYIPIVENHNQIIAYKRKYKNSELLVFCNMYKEKTFIEYNLDEYELLISNYNENIDKQFDSFECRVYIKK